MLSKSNILGFCLLGSAISISLFDYCHYTPSVVFKNTVMDSDADETETEEDKIADDAEEAEEEDDEEEQSTVNDSNVITTVMQRGDSLNSIISKAGINQNDAHYATVAVSKVYKLRSMKAGLKLIMKTRTENDTKYLEELEFKPDYRFKIVLKKHNNKFKAEKVEVPIKKTIKNISGKISPKTPSYSLKQCGMSATLANDMLAAIRQVASISSSRSPVSFEVVYEDYHDENGNCISKPQLLYVAATVNGQLKRIYKFHHNGTFEYIDATGQILGTKNSSMFIKPIAYNKITSPFGMRVHPISGKVKGHTGIDLKASIGTPVRATANGTVTKAEYYSGYGKYICINHSSTLKTAYAHLSKINVRPGQHVMQGQIIGYTGNTGYSSGPHLHYEVIKGGKFINPLSYVKKEPERLTGNSLSQFNKFKRQININLNKKYI